MKKSVVLVSGGVDSYIGYLYVRACSIHEQIIPLYIDYAGTACRKERQIISEMLPNIYIDDKTINLAGHSVGDRSFILGRNMYFALIAARYTDEDIYICGVKNSDMPDNVSAFYITATTTLTQLASRSIRLMSPVRHFEKEQLVDWYINYFGGDIQTLLKTTSCYHPTQQSCHVCYNCFCFYCAVVRHTDQFKWANDAILHEQLEKAKNGLLLPYRTQSVYKIAEKLL